MPEDNPIQLPLHNSPGKFKVQLVSTLKLGGPYYEKQK